MIESIAIENFKSIRQAETKLPFFGAIVGQNAAGKTNLVQTIEFSKDLILGSSISSAQSKIVFTPFELFNLNDISKSASFSFVLSDSQKNKYIFSYAVSLRLVDDELPSIVVQDERLEKVNGEIRETVYLRDRTQKISNGKGADIPLAIDPTHLVISLYKDSQVQHVKDIFRKINILQAATLESRESLVDITAEGLAAVLARLKYKNPNGFQQFEEIAKKIVPTFSTYFVKSLKEELVTPPGKEEYYLVLLEEKNLKGQLSVKSISAGDLRTLFFVANALSMEGGTPLIIEEIENGMHPSRVANVVEHLDTISRLKNIQMLFTTHSPLVINKLRPAEIVYVKKEDDRGTKFVLLAESNEIAVIEKLLSRGGVLTDYINSRL